jgi:uncharacterized protein YecT (DUF1311 family)
MQSLAVLLSAHSSYGCMVAVRNALPKGITDQRAHCLAAGRIAQRCSVGEADLAGVGKEVRDVFTGGDASWADWKADRAFQPRKFMRAVVVASCLAIAAGASGDVLSEELRCVSRNGKITTTECFEQIRNDLDVQLNETYQRILAILKARERAEARMLEVRKQLVESQRSWLAFRNKDCAAVGLIAPAAEDRRPDIVACLMERTHQRLAELRQLDVRMQRGLSGPAFGVFGSDELVQGAPLTLWLQRYWQWTRSFPANRNPSSDNTGSLCGIRQNQSVFFLTGSTKAEPVQRTCSLPRGKPVLIPIINVLADVQEQQGACQSYVNAVRRANESAREISLTINGEPIDVRAASAETGCFELANAGSGLTGRAAGAGIWVMLKPLAPGTYHVRFSGRYEADGFSQDVSYRLTVE